MCQSCEALMINGVYCHEIGCPDAWKDYQVECYECGFEFQPEFKGQMICNECQSEYEATWYPPNEDRLVY